MDRRIRVVIADDSARTRRGLRALLATLPDCVVVGEAADGESALVLIERLRPDVVLLDARMPPAGGAEAARTARSHRPDLAIIGLSMHAAERDGMLAAGADAFFAKTEPVEATLAAVRVLGGRGLV